MTEEDKLLEEYFKRPIAYRAELAKAFGSVKMAVLLSQLYYWSEKGNDRDGTWKTRESIFEETGLSRQEQETARNYAKKLGILEEVKKGIPRKVYFKLNKSIILKRLKEWRAENYPASRQKSRLQVGKRVSVSLAENQPTNTEITSENTKKITSENKATAKRSRHLFNKKFFEQGEKWIASDYRDTPGKELKQIIDWMQNKYKDGVLKELIAFINHWTNDDPDSYEEQKRWEGEDYFYVYPRIAGWIKKAGAFRKKQGFLSYHGRML